MADEIETVDAEVVPAATEPRAVEQVRRVLSPVSVQAAVAAVQRRRVRKSARRRPRGVLGKVVASRSFLVDVHVLGDR